MKKMHLALALLPIVASPATSVAGNCGGAEHVHSLQEMAEKYFNKIDLNNDKVVDRAEFDKSQMSTMIRSFDLLWPNVNGAVGKDAFINSFLEAHSDAYTKT